jgi:fumarate reductase (CoM/CoB) subunit A
MLNFEQVDTDVLVIGGGGAGALAAIYAAREVPQVSLVEKGIFGQAGCTRMGAFSMCAAFGNADPRDNPEVHMKDTIKGGQFINNQELVEVYAYEAPERINELLSFGAKFDEEDGKLKQVMMPGHSYPRACFYDRKTGPMIMGTLAREVRKTGQITMYQELIIVELILNGEEPHYAIGIRWADSSFIVFRAKAVVITTGGCAQIYKNTTTSLDNTGDGLGLLYQVGAELTDMEFVQFYPTTVCSPKLLGLGPTSPAQLRLRTGARLYNGLGEEFMEKTMPRWRFEAPRDLLSQAIYKEIIEGRASPHGGVYMDVTHLSPALIKEKFALGKVYRRLLKNGVDITKRPIETTVAAHFFMGGARINVKGETNIPGLFAGGEAAAGYHGANRLGGNALSEILVSGSRAGQFAGKKAKDLSHRTGDQETLTSSLLGIQDRIDRWKQQVNGVRPIDLKNQIKEIMWEKAGVVREGPKIKEGLDSLNGLRKELQKLCICGEQKYNRELIDAFELQHMLDVSFLILSAGFMREESRGAHFREDFPIRKDDKWLVNIVLNKKGEDLRKGTEKVRLSHFSPES